MKWQASAPSNIALIKYMGKRDATTNIPTNASLSYTLTDLRTTVELESSTGADSWEALIEDFTLSEAAISRFLKHLETLKSKFNYQGHFIVRSSNNFPTASGLASSASSFAALTTVAAQALAELTASEYPPIEVLADWSRQGSGSSCRSFFSPWSIWDAEGARSCTLPYPKLLHQVVLISHEEKAVSSSQAHRLVTSSPAFAGRPERAEQRLQALINAFHEQDWAQAYQLCWDEFQDMHQLFETCKNPFSYMTESTHRVLRDLQSYWNTQGDGPLVTMDAGPNIHLLYRPDQEDHANQIKDLIHYAPFS